jgi:hypothetical protein
MSYFERRYLIKAAMANANATIASSHTSDIPPIIQPIPPMPSIMMISFRG